MAVCWHGCFSVMLRNGGSKNVTLTKELKLLNIAKVHQKEHNLQEAKKWISFPFSKSLTNAAIWY